MTSIADRYIELVKLAVNGELHGPQSLLEQVQPSGSLQRTVVNALRSRGVLAARSVTISESTYATGVGWPSSRSNHGESMIGRARLDNVIQAVDSVLSEGVPGHFIETGVWRGGATILMRAVLAARDAASERVVFVADSFEGLPPSTIEDDDAGYLHLDRTLAVSLEEVQSNFRRYGLLDDRVQFVKGWFRDTLPSLRGHPWAVIRLDGDMYESTMDALVNLYEDLSAGGWLIVDDYNTYESCRRAVNDYRGDHGIKEPIIRIDENGVYWRKSSPVPGGSLPDGLGHTPATDGSIS